MTVEKHSFQAEVTQLLKLMIHSLYSNKEIFLRELISNASDALDKLRFEDVKNTSLSVEAPDLSIKLSILPDSKRLVIEDNGVGMTRQELITHLGTIANSGTRKFLEALSDTQKKDSSLIGQFGVGFYAAFMVAEKVIVESRSALEEGESSWIWESDGQGEYSLSPGMKTSRGTRIELIIKEDDKEFLEEWRLKGIVKKYSDFITYPIMLLDKDNKEERLNTSTPLWVKNKKDNSLEDYQNLYKQLSKDFNPPLIHEHISMEGLTPFQAIVYVPKEAPYDLYTRDNHGLHLYVRRVCISEKCKELIPEYLRFVSGVVETDEIPLNVSREMLQHNTKLTVIKKNLVKKVLSALDSLATNEPETYLSFYKTFGPVLKEGFHFDRDNHEQLSKLARFRSSKAGADEWVSLDTYWERKAEGQTEIYYISGPSYEIVSKSPHLEALTAKGIEVLFLTDPIDEWFIMDYPSHNGHNFKSIIKGDLDLRGVGQSTQDESAEEPPASTLAPLLEAFRTQLKEDIKDVKVSKRLRESPVCLVADESGLSAQMERLIKSQNKDFVGSRKYLEINPTHPIIRSMLKVKEQKGDENLSEWIEILYDTALISEGSQIKDAAAFAKKLTKIMEIAAGASVTK